MLGSTRYELGSDAFSTLPLLGTGYDLGPRALGVLVAIASLMPVGLPGLLARFLLGKLHFSTHAFTYSQLQLFRPSVRAFQLVPTGTRSGPRHRLSVSTSSSAVACRSPRG